MTQRVSTHLVVGVLPVLVTCCPTLWVQVQKDDPSPWPSVPLPGFDATPPAIPDDAANRFDVLEGGARIFGAASYTDRFDPDEGMSDALFRAIDDLNGIRQRYGHSMSHGCKLPRRATLRCLGPLNSSCHVLYFTGLVPSVPAVDVAGQLIPVSNYPLGDRLINYLDLSLDVPGKDGDIIDVCFQSALSSTLVSFVHMSDIQLRDPSITLTDRRVSHALDWFDALSSFEYDEDLASYHQYLVEAVFGTLNAMIRHLSRADAPKFVIHTGDSIDAGAVVELERFHTMIDRLRVPFYELIGNHDVLVFGNLTPTSTRQDDKDCTAVAALLGGAGSPFAPNRVCVDQRMLCPTCSGDEGLLVARSTQSESREHFMSYLAHRHDERLPQSVMPRGSQALYCADANPPVYMDAYSRAHGFDLGTANGHRDGQKLGYYAFVYPTEAPDRNVVMVALNSEDLEEHRGGTRGRLGHTQLAWLKSVLSCVQNQHPRDLVLVFAHQPLSAIDVEPDPGEPGLSVAKVLETSSNVIAFFYGHNHWHSICGDDRKAVCQKFWEVETASLIEFPQEGRLVRIKQISDDLAFLELTAFRERLASQDTEFAHYVSLARRGAERDYCYTQREKPKGRCSVDQRPYRTDGRDANARLFFRLP